MNVECRLAAKGSEKTTRILVIDDDRELCELLHRTIWQEGMAADCCFSGRDGLDRLEQGEYQLVILDVMMPGSDGFAVLEQIRGKSHLPVLLLTAKDDSASKVRGLRNGADDYLTKPFDMGELLARITSLIRRYTRFNQNENHIEKLFYDGLTIDMDAHLIAVQNGTFELAPKEFSLLLYCAKNQGRILTKKQIYEEVWGAPYVYDDSNIMAVISRLRKKMEVDPGNPQYIQTVKGVGYRFNKKV